MEDITSMKNNKFIIQMLLVLITIGTSILNVNIALADEYKTYDGKNVVGEGSDIISSEEIDKGVRVNYIKDGTITIVVDEGSNIYTDDIGSHWKDVTIKLKYGQGNCLMHLYEHYAPDNIGIHTPNIFATDTITIRGLGSGTYILSREPLKNGRGYFIAQTMNGEEQFVDNGKIVVGWKEDGPNWYYGNNDGILQKGWKEIDGRWYYFGQHGVMQRGWIQDNGKWYYLYYDGSRAFDTIIGGYYVNKNGEYVG
jgi:FOG: Glucan-binding domain (YG repeat)